jgi:type IV fimbrial biogenesis protein FimT
MRLRSAGFSLIEAMTVLAILAITLALGLPTFVEMLRSQEVRTAMHLLGSSMAMARNTAVTRGAVVIVCPDNGALACRDDSDWSRGWIVFVDRDRNGRPDTASDLLRSEQAPADGAVQIRSTSGRRLLRYQADGRSGGSTLTVSFCARGQLVGAIKVNNVGRVRSERMREPRSCPT